MNTGQSINAKLEVYEKTKVGKEIYTYIDYIFMRDKELLIKNKDNTLTFICKLKRNVAKALQHNCRLFIADVYGDIYELINKEMKFIFGILCKIVDFLVYEDQIVVLDKYSKVRYFNMEGQLLEVYFGEGIHGLMIYNKKVRYLTDK